MPEQPTPSDAATEISLQTIADYIQSKTVTTVLATTLPGKGRVLLAACGVAGAEILFVEKALRTVLVETSNNAYKELVRCYRRNNFDLRALWYWCALNSCFVEEVDYGESSRPFVSSVNRISNDAKQKVNQLFAPVDDEPSKEINAIIEDFELHDSVDRMELEKLLQVWVYNSFEYSEEPLGYAMYYLASFCSHSCNPNCVWFLNQDEHFVLRARKDLQKGDEITISYLSEESLYEPTYLRRASMQSTKSFLCTCERCNEDLDSSRRVSCMFCKLGSFLLPSIPDPQHTLTEPCSRCGTSSSGLAKKSLQRAEKRSIDFCRKLTKDAEELSDDETVFAPPPTLNEVLSGKERKLIVSNPVSYIMSHSKDFSEFSISSLDLLFETLFPSHWISLVWSDWRAKKCSRKKDHDGQIMFLIKELDIMKKVYGEHTGHEGWTMESLGDAFVLKAGSLCETDSEADLDSVDHFHAKGLASYEEAHSILGLLFGEDHEFASTIGEKIIDLQDTIKIFRETLRR